MGIWTNAVNMSELGRCGNNVEKRQYKYSTLVHQTKNHEHFSNDDGLGSVDVQRDE